ncbi:hypothetical protein POVWA2_043200 [Plasmodium ovale wallikeri]|uniref:Uncharacterized protein n=1 Tax=Plasmodium ovale wallikeri TaxID=864142 RepID=A0A1A8ZE70_PLAOA|nr:hypothetical protein POVWA1_044610 [Plasmodium ovale wallikeri]SBT42123.1 hypothetical protein POVWA2_043200 [Plasmodium ovale wallikeri]
MSVRVFSPPSSLLPPMCFPTSCESHGACVLKCVSFFLPLYKKGEYGQSGEATKGPQKKTRQKGKEKMKTKQRKRRSIQYAC